MRLEIKPFDGREYFKPVIFTAKLQKRTNMHRLSPQHIQALTSQKLNATNGAF